MALPRPSRGAVQCFAPCSVLCFACGREIVAPLAHLPTPTPRGASPPRPSRGAQYPRLAKAKKKQSTSALLSMLTHTREATHKCLSHGLTVCVPRFNPNLGILLLQYSTFLSICQAFFWGSMRLRAHIGRGVVCGTTALPSAPLMTCDSLPFAVNNICATFRQLTATRDSYAYGSLGLTKSSVLYEIYYVSITNKTVILYN